MARIFIADDDPDIRHLVTYALADQGHQVAVAPDGEAALEAVVDDPPDLLVLDLMMPGLNGYEVLEKLHELEVRDKMRVLILSAKGSEHDWTQGYQAGADLYMTKPFDPEELAATVADLLEASKDELKARREAEADRAHLLSQLEDVFGDA